MGGLAWNAQQQQHLERGGGEWKKWSGRVGIGVLARNTVRMEPSESVGRAGGGRTLATGGGSVMVLPGCGYDVCTVSTFFLLWDCMRTRDGKTSFIHSTTRSKRLCAHPRRWTVGSWRCGC